MDSRSYEKAVPEGLLLNVVKATVCPIHLLSQTIAVKQVELCNGGLRGKNSCYLNTSSGYSKWVFLCDLEFSTPKSDVAELNTG